MDKKTKYFLMIFLGICGFTQYYTVEVEGSTIERMSVAVEEEILSRDAIDDAAAGSAEADSNPPRDPFWPVGYWPEPSQTVVVGDENAVEPEVIDGAPVDFVALSLEEQQLIKSKMRIGGILSQPSGCIAIINEQLLKERDTLQLEANGRKYEFLLKTLTPKRVLLESLSD